VRGVHSSDSKEEFCGVNRNGLRVGDCVADAFIRGGFVLKVTLCVDLVCGCSCRQLNIVGTGSCSVVKGKVALMCLTGSIIVSNWATVLEY